ncbi:MAG TPA: hypothetical protein VLJ57_08270 [Burkholderiaceae bacterium]|nr:hypothetical protein [Burkholderiaceae bacterium]
MKQIGIVIGALALLGACSSSPPAPDWQVNAHGSMERSVAAYLAGNARVEALEFERARSEVARTGQPAQAARVELMRCAGRVASLVFEPCAGFEPLRQDVPAPERAYADYLAARLQAQDLALLPAPQRAAAAPNADAAALKNIADPLSRLVAAGVLLQAGRASPDVQALAVDTASAQGWRRPLLAWLHLQAQRAEQGGNAQEAARLRRRIALVENTPGAR